MDLSEDVLEACDYLYVGFDRFRFISCRSCCRFTPFLFYLPPNEKLKHLLSCPNDQLLYCAECLPTSEELGKYYTSTNNVPIFNARVVELLKGYKYLNPYYRMFALNNRVLITAETALGNIKQEFENLAIMTNVINIQNIFPNVHYIPNKKYSGLQEINSIVCTKVSEIRDYYDVHKLDFVEHISDSGNTEQTELLPPAYAQTNDTNICDDTVVYTEGLIIAADRRFKLTILGVDNDYACDICLLTEKNALKYGDFIEKRQTRTLLRCHYFCLLSGTVIVQQGCDTSGILGFLVKDILESFQKYRDKICSYCLRPSAAIKCAESRCQRWFHYICGYKHGCLTQFVREHLSFCHEHQPIYVEKPHGNNTQCGICWDFMPPYKPISNFYGICPPEESTNDKSFEYTWYHRKCIQRAAFESGYYFKCPNCYENKSFIEHAQLHGIFVPMRDASWELEKDAYKEIHQKKCTADYCIVRNGSTKNLQLVGCKACGGGTMHIECAGIKNEDEYVCSYCMDATFIKLF